MESDHPLLSEVAPSAAVSNLWGRLHEPVRRHVGVLILGTGGFNRRGSLGWLGGRRFGVRAGFSVSDREKPLFGLGLGGLVVGGQGWLLGDYAPVRVGCGGPGTPWCKDGALLRVDYSSLGVALLPFKSVNPALSTDDGAVLGWGDEGTSVGGLDVVSGRSEYERLQIRSLGVRGIGEDFDSLSFRETPFADVDHSGPHFEYVGPSVGRVFLIPTFGRGWVRRVTRRSNCGGRGRDRRSLDRGISGRSGHLLSRREVSARQDAMTYLVG